MPNFAVTASYRPEHWVRLAGAPAAGGAGLRRALAGVGGEITSMHWVLDTLELVAMVTAPSTASMAAVTVSMLASGVFTTFTARQVLNGAELKEVLDAAVAAGFVPADRATGDDR